jgi:hypothetical protein
MGWELKMKLINDTTFLIDDIGEIKPKTTIGGSKPDKFVPNINISYHDDEFYINLNRKYKIVTNEVANLSSDKIKQKIGKETDEYYVDENGRFKWDIVFDEIPSSMNIEWKIKSSTGISFYYQPPLSQDEIVEGVRRPDDVVGSYAVYCNKSHNKYKTGKLAHIYRPFVIDVNNKREWCELKIENGNLTITLPGFFMKEAAYPVRLDPTFGYTSAGASETNYTSSNYPRGLVYDTYTAATGDTITKFTVYCNTATTTPNYLQVGAYAMSSGTPSTRLGAITTLTISSESKSWVDSPDVSLSMSNGTTYCCAFGFNSWAGGYIWINFDAVSSAEDYPSAGGDLPSSWTHSGYLDRRESMYATYTESGLTQKTSIDSATGSDIILIRVKTTVSDSSSGSDDISNSGGVSTVGIDDSGVFSDLVFIKSILRLSEIGAYIDDGSDKSYIYDSDVLTGVDDLGIIANIMISDSGVGVDDLKIIAKLALGETASGTDLATRGGLAYIALQDSGVGVDSISLRAILGIADSGSGSDEITGKIKLSISESGVVVDEISVKALLALADSGLSLDDITNSGNYSKILSDYGTFIDSISVVNNQGFVEQIYFKSPIAKTVSFKSPIAKTINYTAVLQ